MTIGDIGPLLAEQDTAAAWGVELQIDLSHCNPAVITSGDALKRFALELCAAIDMEPYGAPIAERFALHDPDAAGYSVVLLITTSLISGHFSDRLHTAYINVFSCKPFDPRKAAEFIRTALGPDTVIDEMHVAPRGRRKEATA